jgi:uncharacterized protein (TIGR02145 family)
MRIAAVTFLVLTIFLPVALASEEASVTDTSGRSGMFEDARDNETYIWIQIGDQIWMAENLRFATATGSWCWENDTGFCESRGRLYTWDAAKQAPPDGWHLPSDEEWKILEMTLGLSKDQADLEGDRGGPGDSTAAVLKKCENWPDEYDGRPIPVSNASGFSAVPTGFFARGEFTHDGYTAWWTATPHPNGAWLRFLRFFDNKITRVVNRREFAFSVRCVRDQKSPAGEEM